MTLVGLLASGMRDFYAIMALALAGFVAGTIVQEFWRGVRARRRMHGESAPAGLRPARSPAIGGVTADTWCTWGC